MLSRLFQSFAAFVVLLWPGVALTPAQAQGAAAVPEPPNVPKAVDRARAAAVAAAGDQLYSRGAIWAEELVGGETVEVPIQLYAGNEYVFALGSDGHGSRPEIKLRDGDGRLIPAALMRSRGSLLLTVTPTVTGVYRLHIGASGEKVALALTYVFR